MAAVYLAAVMEFLAGNAAMDKDGFGRLLTAENLLTWVYISHTWTVGSQCQKSCLWVQGLRMWDVEVDCLQIKDVKY